MSPPLAAWLEYFERNAVAADETPWDADASLSEREREAIRTSIAKFQLGEYSEGTGLMRFAEDHARRRGDDRLVRITRLFVEEERRHAFLLKRFMDLHGLPTLRRSWTDAVFRRLRRAAAYEWSITVLVVAEVIALVYYRALSAATSSAVLKAVCRKILADETEHVRYEAGLIRSLHAEKGAFGRGFARFRHRFLFLGTAVVVYVDHHRALRAGGYPFGPWMKECVAAFDGSFGAQRAAPTPPVGAAAAG